VRRTLTPDKLESLQGSRPYDPRQDNCEAIDGSRRNLALDKSALADGDQADIGWLRLSERCDGPVDDRGRRCSFVVAAVGCQNACLLACGCEVGRFTTELIIGNRDPVGSAGLGRPLDGRSCLSTTNVAY
jgi:hypothetical protein